MNIGRLVTVIALLGVVVPEARAQFTSLAWNASTGDEIPINIGSVTTVNVDAYPGMNYALLAAKGRDLWYSDVGLIEVDLNDPDFTIGIDGFNPSHHLFNWGFVNGNGDFDFSFVPYPTGSPVEDPIYFQVLAQDPTAPLGLSLSNFVGAESQALKPLVYTVQPRSIVEGGLVTIVGDYLDGTPSLGQLPIVTMGQDQLVVVSASRNQITATVPVGARSGSIRVHSDRGSSSDLYYNVDHYVVVTGQLVAENTPPADLLDGHMSVVGQIDSQTDTDLYRIHLEVGEELFVEVFNYDSLNQMVAPYNPAAWQSVQLNSELSFRMPNVPIDPLIHDNDGGPGFACGIGVSTAERFVAPFSGDYEVTISSAFQYTIGYYLLNTWTKLGSPNEPPELMGIHPNVLAQGAEVEIYCLGIDFNDPTNISVEFRGPAGTWLPTTPYYNGAGHLATIVPATAETGHLRVRNAQNILSTFDSDDYPSFYLVVGTITGEGSTYNFSGSMQIAGSLGITQEVDNYVWNLNAGDIVSFRAMPFDLINGRIIKGEYFSPTWVDPQIQIQDLLNGPIHAIDIHSGPGISAEIGEAVPKWVAPRTDGYEFSVRSWFFLTQGTYLVDVVVE